MTNYFLPVLQVLAMVFRSEDWVLAPPSAVLLSPSGLHLIFSALCREFELLLRVLYPDGPAVLPVVACHVGCQWCR